jgi:hypothetical protein
MFRLGCGLLTNSPLVLQNTPKALQMFKTLSALGVPKPAVSSEIIVDLYIVGFNMKSFILFTCITKFNKKIIFVYLTSINKRRRKMRERQCIVYYETLL